ncbi:unnamed protein product [Adineta ricciae]|uniref:Methyltransferase FkbM domain-containing protein n=1 Tax=Adineta ricciae TaxID=249248 RepID=A0A816ASF9_ADIRI|nr:unnamed protein product [Adineta ricciae]CAF1602006.1 unnamed protein product [Adineta ricciae]
MTFVGTKKLIFLRSLDGKVLRKIIIFVLLAVCLYRFVFDTRRLKGIVLNYLHVEQNRYNVSPNVYLIDLYATSTTTTFRCIKTKPLVRNISTTICLYNSKRDRYVSGAFSELTSIWEEKQVTRTLQYLIRHPTIHFIDIGANIGTYTMYVAALGRFVLAIDCFAPNLVRLRRAVQLMNVHEQVVLVQNAIYSRSGEYLRLSLDTANVGGQRIRQPSHRYRETKNTSIVNPYIVKTITFDELLPILDARSIRSVLMKIDIEGSEGFVLETGSRIFDSLHIPLIQMEWKIVQQNNNQTKRIIDFLKQRQYDPMEIECKMLDSEDVRSWPDEIYWLKRNASSFC